MRLTYRNNTWWTKERVLVGLKRFWDDHHAAPTNDRPYNELKQFTGVIRNGRSSNHGWDQKYPSAACIANHFKGMREAWLALLKIHPELPIDVDRGYQDWTGLEDWFITESVGLLPRKEVSRLLKRSDPAIKRRLYDLGNINSYTRWGWTVNHSARVLRVPHYVIMKYIEHGEIPFFQGIKCSYIDPADLLIIREYNWKKKRHPKELETAVRKSLMLRVCYALLGYNRYRYNYHKIQPRVDFQSRNPKLSQPLSPTPKLIPSDIKQGDRVRVTGESRLPRMLGREGQVKHIHWSRKYGPKKPSNSEARWMVTVEFKKLKAHGRKQVSLIKYAIPITSLTKLSPEPTAS